MQKKGLLQRRRTKEDARAYAALGRVLPRGLRHGFTVWMRRSA